MIRRKIIEIDEKLCNDCGECVTACAEGAIRIIDGKAKLVSDKYCDGWVRVWANVRRGDTDY